VNYPELKRAVFEQWKAFGAQVILIEDKASGTQLIQELIAEGIHAVTKYSPEGDKVMRAHAQTATIENGFVHLPRQSQCLAEFVHEVTTFPKGKFDDQVDSMAQALDWIKQASLSSCAGWVEFYARMAAGALSSINSPKKVRLKAPPGIRGNFYIGKGPIMTIDDEGTLEVGKEHVETMIRNGWTRLT